MHKWLIRILMLIVGGGWIAAAGQAEAGQFDILINEIMYNPPAANTGGEFVEIYNRGSTAVDVSNWQLEDSTQVMFTLPPASTIPAGGCLVLYDDVAAVAFYGLNPAFSFGPYTGGLDGGGERIALKNAGGVVIDEVTYDDNWPWPSEPDGTGPSLELLNPWLDNNQGSSWGFGQPYTPGTANNPASPGLGEVVISELMYNPGTLNTGGEYLELYNRTASAIQLSGWQLAGGIEYTFPAVTLNAGAYLVVAGDPNVPGFYGMSNWVGPYTGKLDNSGELVVLQNNLGLIMDVLNYEDSSPWPVEADGFGPSLELLDVDSDNNDPANWGIGQPYTPGAANAPALSGGGDIAITEIMYEPRMMRYMQYVNPFTGGYFWTEGDDPIGEYIELLNRGTETIDLTGWRLLDEDGILFTFTAGMSLLPNHYLVVCQDSAAIAARYGISNVAGDFNPACNGLSGGGERLTLLNAEGVVVDTVHYNDLPPWPTGPDQLGVSLECLDPWSDNSRPENWRGFTKVSGPTHTWQYVETTGVATSNTLYFYLNGAGEWLVDTIVITPSAGGGDIMPNGSFEPAETGWSKTGNHAGTYWTSLDAHDGTACEHMVATAAGGSSSNSLNCVIPGMIVGQEYTLSCWVKYLSGHNTLTFRLSYNGLLTTVTAEGGYEEVIPASPAVGDEVYFNRGTPGRANSRGANGLPPFVNVDQLQHSPKRPGSADTVIITAAVICANPVTAVTLDYEVWNAPYQSASQSLSLPMNDEGTQGDRAAGDGMYSTAIPPLSSKTLVRYRVTVTDNTGSWTYPDVYEPNPNRAYFVYDGEEDTNLPAYFLIAPPATLEALNANIYTRTYYDATLVVDGLVYDHIGIHYKGQGWRVHPKKSWKVAFNKGEYLRDMSRLDLVMHLPVMQKVIHDMFLHMGQENLANELVRLYLNGSFYGVELAQESVNNTWLERHGLSDNGEVYKSSGCPPLDNWPFSDPEDLVSDLDYYANPSVYPMIYEKKGDPLGSFTSINGLADLVTNTPDAQLLPALMNTVELDHWLYDWAVQVGTANSDIVGNNWYVIKPAEPGSKWLLRTFDFTHAFGCTGSVGVGAHTACQTYNTDPYMFYNKWQQRCYQIPEFENRFLVIFHDVLTNYLTVEKFNALLEEAYDRTLIDRQDEIRLGYGGPAPYVMDAGDYANIKTYFASRRTWLLNTWLSGKTYTPPANSHPTIRLSAPMSIPSEIRIGWTFADTENDACLVDLYWTDMKWNHLQPIPGAQQLSAGYGTFAWSVAPTANSQTIYVLAKIYDQQSYLCGYDLSPSVFPMPADCAGMQAAGHAIPGDFNRDCQVNLQDILIFLQDWLQCYDPENLTCTELP